MKRQGLITTIGELRTLADELETQVELNKLQVIKDYGWAIRFQLNIINKSGLSDEWEFEKYNQKQNVQEGVNNSDTLRTETQTASSDNPQDDPGQTSGVASVDTGDSTFPADLNSNNNQQGTVATKRLDVCPSAQSKDVIGCNARYPVDTQHIKSEGKEDNLTKV